MFVFLLKPIFKKKFLRAKRAKEQRIKVSPQSQRRLQNALNITIAAEAVVVGTAIIIIIEVHDVIGETTVIGTAPIVVTHITAG